MKMTGASGLSKSRLGRMHDVMAGHVNDGSMPGLVTLVSRHGETDVDAIGMQAIGGAPMQRDTIFRITSMTKPVTAEPRPIRRSTIEFAAALRSTDATSQTDCCATPGA
jgi:hypothetical protein